MINISNIGSVLNKLAQIVPEYKALPVEPATKNSLSLSTNTVVVVVIVFIIVFVLILKRRKKPYRSR